MFVSQYLEFQIEIIKPAIIHSDELEIYFHELYVSIAFTETLAVIISNYGINILRFNAFIKKAFKIEYPVSQNTVTLIKTTEHFEKPFIIKNGLVAYIASN